MTYLFVTLLSCKKEVNQIRICGSSCPSVHPWRVESLDLGLPCFATKAACENWANTNGYSGKPCVECD